MSMTPYRPFGGPLSLREVMNRLFEGPFFRPEGYLSTLDYQYPMDLCEKEDEFIVRMCAPGLLPEDIDITISHDTLTIKGQLNEPEYLHPTQTTGETRQVGQHTEPRRGQGQRTTRTSCMINEIQYGSFMRQVTLPTAIDADKASVQFENGMLTLHLPKSAAAKPRRLQLKPATTGSTGTRR